MTVTKKKPPVPERAPAVSRQSRSGNRLKIAGAPQQQIEFLLYIVHGLKMMFQGSFWREKLEQFRFQHLI
jgi:hypothetical protein